MTSPTLPEMTPLERVEVLLHGDDTRWYAGTVDEHRARKMWVNLDPCDVFPDGFIADEGNIRAWRPLAKDKP